MIQIIEQYLEIIREIIVRKSTKNCDLVSFNKMMETQLKIDKNTIEIILTSLDVIGDSQEAISNFLQNGLGTDVGEKYIRLYGVLSAIYLHSQAVLSLARYFKINDINTIDKKLKSNKILDIRHKLGAHSVNYKNSYNTISCYTPIRMTMEAHSLTFYNMNPESDEYQTINLNTEIENYFFNAQEIVETTTIKCIKTVYKDSKEEIKLNMKRIDEINREVNIKLRQTNKMK
jgi:hypothetical protein